MKYFLITVKLICAFTLLSARAQAQSNGGSAGATTNTPPLIIQATLPNSLAITNTLTIKPDDETQKLLQRVGASFGAKPIEIRFDNQSMAQIMQRSSNPIVIQIDDKGMLLLKEATADKWFKKELFFSSLLGAGVAVLAGFTLHKIEMRQKRRDDDEFVRNVLKSIEAELDALSEIFRQGIGKHLKAKTGRMFSVRLALSQDYFTVYGANAVHLGKIKYDIAKRIIFLYQTLKAQIEAFRINNDYIEKYNAILYQLNTSYPARTDGVVRTAKELETLLNEQGDELVRLAQITEQQYLALKEFLKEPNKEPQPHS
jgi:primosomal protein N''